MGMPSLNIRFATTAAEVAKRATRGIVMIILRGAVPAKNPLNLQDASEVPASVSAANRDYINMIFKGNEFSPKGVYAYFLAQDAAIDEALSWAAKQSIDYIVMPTAETDGVSEQIMNWVTGQKQHKNEVRAVLSNTAADSEYIVNFITNSITCDSKSYSAEQFTPRIAGIICGTDISHSVTFAALPEVTDCTRMSKLEMDEAEEAGKLFCYYDGEKCKLSRGVNSLTTTTADKGSAFKKIKLIDVMAVIKKDLRLLCEDSYIGKYPNNYSNRCLLMSAVQSYFDELATEGVVSEPEVSFNIPAIKSAMRTAGIDYSEMTDEEVKKYDFGSSVFLRVRVHLLDAIEDIDIDIAI